MARLDLVSTDVDDPILNPIFDRFREAGRELPDLYRALGNAPAMLRAWVDMAWPLRLEAATSRALRELMIMRVAVLTGAAFEWEAHWPAAVSAGVRPSQLARLDEWRTADEFTPTERLAMQLVDEMIADGAASAATVAALRQEFGDGECVELILTAGFYSCVSHTLLTLGIEPDGRPVDDDRREIFARLTGASEEAPGTAEPGVSDHVTPQI